MLLAQLLIILDNQNFMKSIFLLCLLFFSSQAFSQEYTINGTISDAENGESLIGASVLDAATGSGTTTNVYGYYSLTLPAGEHELIVSYLGYTESRVVIELDENKKLDIDLAVEGQQIEEIVVTAKQEDRAVKEVQMSVNRLDIKTIKRVPSLLGEQDVIKSIQLLPGVTTIGEGAAGFNVRGGSIDQNLVLLDEAPVYNSSHLFGFFSVFNPDAVKDVQLYKGGIPARFGGRLSSILDVRMKEGNVKDYEVNGGIGTIFSRLSVEGPIIKDKASFIVAGRRSYIDLLAKPFLSEGLKKSVLNFYDLTAKANYKFDSGDQFFVSGYFGRDNFGFGDAAGFNWGNQTITTRYNHLFSEKIFANFTAYYSNYDYKINFGETAQDVFDWSAKIKNFSFKPEVTYYINPNNKVRFGGQSILYEFQPANAVAVTEGVETDISLDIQRALESGIFIENELNITSAIKANYGLRYSHFAYLGGRNKYLYGEAAELGNEKPLTGVEYVEKGDVISSYGNLEPRAGINIELDNQSSMKLSYNRTAQYIHLLSNTTASTPLDIWTPSTNNIKPQKADQVAVGYFRNLQDNEYELSAEFYYKWMQDIVDYIDGSDLILNEYVEGQILPGEGRAYGTELLLRKVEGRLTGWVGYTLSRTERNVPGINNNEWYPSRYDKTHEFNITGIYDINDRFTLSTNFIYATGTPGTLPTSRYTQQGVLVPHNTDGRRNNFRLPAYHRMDVSLTINPKKSNKRWKGEWVIGIYNVYNRRNAFTIYTKQYNERVSPGETINSEAIRLSVVGNFIPSISYNFKFK